MDGYHTIRLQVKTIERYKGFSRKVTRSYSETLDVMMDFFEWHGISPFKRFAKQISAEEEKTRKRIDAVIAIIKNIEKYQTKPTNAMLLSLFEEKAGQEVPLELVEKKFMGGGYQEQEMIENTTVSKTQYDRLEHKLNAMKQDFGYVLDKAKPVKSSFGKDYVRLELTEEELIAFKKALNNL